MSVKRVLIALIMLIIAAQLLGIIVQYEKRPQMSISLKAPDFSWKAFDGKTHAIKELAGRPVVLHFWASWCAPCREELPQLLTSAASFKNIAFLLISGDQNLDTAQRFVKQAQLLSGTMEASNIYYAIDSDASLTFGTFQTVVYPETIFMDAQHNLRRKFPGPVDWNGAQVRSYLEHFK